MTVLGSWLAVLGSVALVWCCGQLMMKATEVKVVRRRRPQ